MERLSGFACSVFFQQPHPFVWHCSRYEEMVVTPVHRMVSEHCQLFLACCDSYTSCPAVTVLLLATSYVSCQVADLLLLTFYMQPPTSNMPEAVVRRLTLLPLFSSPIPLILSGSLLVEEDQGLGRGAQGSICKGTLLWHADYVD